MPDPDATKPEDWVEEPLMPDPDATKPEGWEDEEPQLVPDPAARKPEDWDDEEDGEWAPSEMSNPKCKVGGRGVG
jgi:calnexin